MKARRQEQMIASSDNWQVETKNIFKIFKVGIKL